MNVEAFERVIHRLRGTGPYEDKGPISEYVFEMDTWKCSTAACAIGHLESDPWFEDQGFVIDQSPNLAGYFGPCYQGLRGFQAISKFFRIDNSDACFLFDGIHYRPDVSPKEVANALEEYVENNKKG